MLIIPSFSRINLSLNGGGIDHTEPIMIFLDSAPAHLALLTASHRHNVELIFPPAHTMWTLQPCCPQSTFQEQEQEASEGVSEGVLRNSNEVIGDGIENGSVPTVDSKLAT